MINKIADVAGQMVMGTVLALGLFVAGFFYGMAI
jgi:hypothetical protein